MFTFKTIRARVIAVVMAVSVTTALLMFFGAVMISYSTNQSLLEVRVKNLTKVIGGNARAAVSFHDQIESQRILDTLEVVPSIAYAELKNNTDELLAVYRRKNTQTNNLPSIFSDTFFERDDLYQDDIFIGYVKIVSDSSALAPAMKAFGILGAVLSICTLLIAYFVASQLQTKISKPIENLNDSMQRLARNSSNVLLIESDREDEIGTLLQNFNEMVFALNEREKILSQKAQLLREQISRQSHQLSQEESKRLEWLQNVARFLQHELRNTLLGFSSSLDILERKLEQKELFKYIERARKSSIFMAKLLHNIGTTTSIEAALLDEQKEQISVGKIVNGWIENHKLSTGDNNIDLVTSGSGLVSANGHRIEQMLEKLVGNAETYSLPETKIKVSVVAYDDEVVLSVANQGKTLPEDKNLIFNLFVSQRQQSDSGDQHFGLGLYIVKIISEAYSGYVEAKDLDGASGAVFEVHLPVAKKDHK